MVTTNQIAEIAGLVSDPGRAAILLALMDGRALTAGELADVAGITPQTASSHLRRLAEARLIEAWKQGRHRYHRLARPEIARMLEGIMQIASAEDDIDHPGCSSPADALQPHPGQPHPGQPHPGQPHPGQPHPGQPGTSPPGTSPPVITRPRRRITTGPRDAAMRRARTCYDHIAGRLGVAIADAMDADALVRRDGEAAVITARGFAFLERWEIPLETGPTRTPRAVRAVCRPCLDWSERRFHFAGRLGAALCAHFLERDYLRRQPKGRALEITRAGEAALRDMFGITDPI